MLKKSMFGLSAISLCLMSNYGFAAEKPAADDIESIEVYGKSYRSTGTKSSLTPIESPMSFEVYDNKLLELRQVDTVNEALRYVSGITPENRSTVTIFDQYTIRGFESYRNFYDGLPLQYNLAYNLAPQVDAYATQSVEILKGPASVLYGSAPPGGMVNQTAKTPQASSEHNIRARIGSNSLAELALDSTGAITDGVNYRFIAIARSRDGQQQTTEEERITIAPSVTFEISEQTSLNLNLYYQDDPKMVPSTPLPAKGTLYEASYGKLDADAYAGDENWAEFAREVTMIGYKLNHEFSDSISFLQNFRYTNADATQQNSYDFGLADADKILTRTAYKTIEDAEGFVIDNQLAVQFGLANTNHQLLFGFEYQTLDSTFDYADTFGANTPTLDLSNPDHSQFNAATTAALDSYRQFSRLEQSQRGFYLQDEIKLDALTVIAGLRYDNYYSVTDDTKSGISSSQEIDQSDTTFRIAAIYTFDNNIAPYASYSESFEPTSGVDTLTGKAFKPTTAEQIEVGMKYHNNDATTKVTAAFFDLRKQDVVVNTPDFMKYTQNGEVQSKGFEISVYQQLTDTLDVTVNLTDMDVEVIDNPQNPALEGKTPIWVAEQQASMWLNYFFNDALEFNGGVRYVGESQLDALNSDTVPGYTLLDAAASYRFNDSYKIGLAVSNLTDKRYVGACFDINGCWMGAERSVELSLNASF
nr:MULTISPECIES: TonB-dependent siderophore receptor [unclassified Pseudoalteromonas]